VWPDRKPQIDTAAVTPMCYARCRFATKVLTGPGRKWRGKNPNEQAGVGGHVNTRSHQTVCNGGCTEQFYSRGRPVDSSSATRHAAEHGTVYADLVLSLSWTWDGWMTGCCYVRPSRYRNRGLGLLIDGGLCGCLDTVDDS